MVSFIFAPKWYHGYHPKKLNFLSWMKQISTQRDCICARAIHFYLWISMTWISIMRLMFVALKKINKRQHMPLEWTNVRSTIHKKLFFFCGFPVWHIRDDSWEVIQRLKIRTSMRIAAGNDCWISKWSSLGWSLINFYMKSILKRNFTKNSILLSSK